MEAIRVSSCTLAFLIVNSCYAQSGLSLDDAIERALQSRASLKAEAERIPAAKGLRVQAGLWPNPEFQFQNENLRPGQTYSRDVDTLALVNQSLDILGKRKQRVAVAEESVSRAQAEYELARWRTVQRVKTAYWAARGARQIQEILGSTVENFQKVIDYHAAQLSAGAIAEQDLLRVRLEGERLKIAASSAAIDADRARFELLKEMGQPGAADIVLTEPLTPAAADPIGIEQALAQRIEIKVARAALNEAQARAKFQDVSARPDLNVTLGYKRTQLFDAPTGVNTAIASLRITIPSSDRNQGNRAAAEADIRRQQQLLAAVEADLKTEYLEALTDYNLRRSQFTGELEPLREHAATISEIAAAAYAEGGTDLLRLLDAERARLDADLAWAKGLVEYRQSLARLEAAEGVGR